MADVASSKSEMTAAFPNEIQRNDIGVSMSGQTEVSSKNWSTFFVSMQASCFWRIVWFIAFTLLFIVIMILGCYCPFKKRQ
ncbi:hypothetical protein VSK91_09495 [Bacillus swezeyi]|uniref:hypothetical protein n=1 Tax=Bacillus swezeyi TaxID=1925020 RepID=UPI0039C761B6